jgi:chromosomal replication initiation ATPase DnaA
MPNITIPPLDEELQAALERKAEAEGIKVEDLIVLLIGKHVEEETAKGN